jgi:hypothetical protein
VPVQKGRKSGCQGDHVAAAAGGSGSPQLSLESVFAELSDVLSLPTTVSLRHATHDLDFIPFFFFFAVMGMQPRT